jgi:hypothetical protein
MISVCPPRQQPHDVAAALTWNSPLMLLEWPALHGPEQVLLQVGPVPPVSAPAQPVAAVEWKEVLRAIAPLTTKENRAPLSLLKCNILVEMVYKSYTSLSLFCHSRTMPLSAAVAQPRMDCDVSPAVLVLALLALVVFIP